MWKIDEKKKNNNEMNSIKLNNLRCLLLFSIAKNFQIISYFWFLSRRDEKWWIEWRELTMSQCKRRLLLFPSQRLNAMIFVWINICLGRWWLAVAGLSTWAKCACAWVCVFGRSTDIKSKSKEGDAYFHLMIFIASF